MLGWISGEKKKIQRLSHYFQPWYWLWLCVILDTMLLIFLLLTLTFVRKCKLFVLATLFSFKMLFSISVLTQFTFLMTTLTTTVINVFQLKVDILNQYSQKYFYFLKHTDLELNKMMQILLFSIHLVGPNVQVHA